MLKCIMVYQIFQVQEYILKAEGFVEKVRKWSSYNFQGIPSFILAHKIKALKVDLKDWNEQTSGNVVEQVKSLIKELQTIERAWKK